MASRGTDNLERLMVMEKVEDPEDRPRGRSPTRRSDQRSAVKIKLTSQAYGEVRLGELKHHVFMYTEWREYHRAFCAGSIISKTRVLTSAHCFITNRKRRKRDYKRIEVVAGSLSTIIFQEDDKQQWRTVERLYTQRFLRFPAFNLAILEVGTPWLFNSFVNKIPYTQLNQDFDGVCLGTTVKITKSWSTNKRLRKSNFRMINNQECEYQLLQSCRLYYCTEYDDINTLSSTETEGGGLICYGTGDPAENGNQGVLVGVTSQINLGLPSLHNRIGMFHRWVADGCVGINANLYLLYLYYVFAMG